MATDPLLSNAALTSNSEDKEQLIQGQWQLYLHLKTLDERILKLEEKNLSQSKEIHILKQQFLASEERNQRKMVELIETNKDLSDELNDFKNHLVDHLKSMEIHALQDHVDELQNKFDILNQYQTPKNYKLGEEFQELQSKLENIDEDSNEMKKLHEDHIFNLEELEKKFYKSEQENQKNKNELLKSIQKFETKLEIDEELNKIELLKRIKNLETKLEMLDELHRIVKEGGIHTSQHNFDINILQDIPVLQSEMFILNEELHEKFKILQVKIKNLETENQQGNLNLLNCIKCLIHILNKDEAGTDSKWKKYLNNHLIDAANNGRQDVVTLLLDLGAVVDTKDDTMGDFIQSHHNLFGQSVESNHQIRCEGINIDKDKDVLSFKPDDFKRVGVYITAEPLSPYHKYFEIEIIEIDLKGAIGIGLVPLHYDLSCYPGWTTGGIGYHSDDGKLYKACGPGSDFGPICKIGDRMGCGIKFEQISYEDLHLLQSVPVFFTLNGQELGTIDWPLPEGGLFPAVGLNTSGDTIKLFLSESNGRTPLHYAAARGHLGVVNELLNHSSDTHCKDNAGKTALNLATEFDHLEVVEILKLNGAS